MKITNVTPILIFISAILILSCKKDEPSSSGGSSGGSSACTPNMTATFNGDTFSGCGSSALFPSVGGLPPTYMSVAGNSRDASNNIKYSIGIKLNTPDISQITTTSYIVNNGSTVPSGQPFSVNITAKIAEGSGTLYNSLSGNLIINQVSSTHIKGTFNYVAKKAGTVGNGPDTIIIDNGFFDYDIL